MNRTYIYGIVRDARDSLLGIAGIDGVSPVRIVTNGGLGCVVSNYRGPEFGALPRETLVRSLLAHQRVVEHVMEAHAVLPVKFGTLLANSQEVPALLSQRHGDFVDALAAIQDKIEIEVAATWDLRQVLQEVSRQEEVARVRDALPREPERQTTEQRIHLGQVVKVCLDRRRDSYRERMVSLLRPLAVDTATNALVSDEMVMNVAFLVERSRQHEFDAAVQLLDNLFQNKIAFRVIGPLPPYSFCTLEIMRLTQEQVEEARQVLRLGDTNIISEAEVRKAYRHLAAQDQRDLRQADGEVQARFARLRWASELLLSYCRAQKETREDEGRLALTSPGSNCLFAIAISRPASGDIQPTRFGVLAKV